MPASDDEVEGGAGVVDSLAGGVAAGVAGRALDSLFSSIGESAVWAFSKVLGWIDESGSPSLDESWFTAVYARTYWLAATVAFGALVWAVTAGAIRNGVTGVLSTLPRVLYVALGLAVAVPLVDLLLEFTDWLSAEFAAEASANLQVMPERLGAVLVGGGVGAVAARVAGIPSFVLALIALVIVVGALLVWLQLIFRTAVVYLLLASAAFPAVLSINRSTSRPLRKIAAWIVAMAFVKPGVVLAFWIGSAPVAAGTDAGVATVLTSAGVMTTAVFVPWALFRLLDLAGAQVVGMLAVPAGAPSVRADVQQPVATYRRTATMIREHASAVHDRGLPAFTPTRPRTATALVATAATGTAPTRGSSRSAGDAPGRAWMYQPASAAPGVHERPAAVQPGDDAPSEDHRARAIPSRSGLARNGTDGGRRGLAGGSPARPNATAARPAVPFVRRSPPQLPAVVDIDHRPPHRDDSVGSAPRALPAGRRPPPRRPEGDESDA